MFRVSIYCEMTFDGSYCPANLWTSRRIRKWCCMAKSTIRFIGFSEYLVNKPLSMAGISEDNAQDWKIVRKMSSLPRSETVKFWFYNPPNNFSRRTQVDPSCIFCGFFSFFPVWNCQPAFIYPSLASAKSLFWFSLTNLKFSVNVCSPFGFPSVEIKQTTDIKSDSGYPLISIVRFCITWSVLSNESPQNYSVGCNNVYQSQVDS